MVSALMSGNAKGFCPFCEMVWYDHHKPVASLWFIQGAHQVQRHPLMGHANQIPLQWGPRLPSCPGTRWSQARQKSCTDSRSLGQKKTCWGAIVVFALSKCPQDGIHGETGLLLGTGEWGQQFAMWTLSPDSPSVGGGLLNQVSNGPTGTTLFWPPHREEPRPAKQACLGPSMMAFIMGPISGSASCSSRSSAGFQTSIQAWFSTCSWSCLRCWILIGTNHGWRGYRSSVDSFSFQMVPRGV